MKKTIKVELKWDNEELVERLAKRIETEFKLVSVAGLNKYVYVTTTTDFKQSSKLLCWLEANYAQNINVKEITVTATY